MTTTGCELYNDFKNRENTWQGGFVSPERFAGWLHESQIEISNELVKALGNNQVITDNLRVFIKSVQLQISQFAGIVAYPKDYRRFAALRYFSKKEGGVGCLCKDFDLMERDKGEINCRPLTEEEKAEALKVEEACENTIELLDTQFWGSICDDEIAGPVSGNPYGTQNDKGFRVLPKKIGIVVLDYVAIPVRPVFNFTRDARHNFTCLPSTTTLVWGEEMIPELFARIKKRYNAFKGDGEGYEQGEAERQIAGG